MLTKREIRMIASEICKIMKEENLCEDTFLCVRDAAALLGCSTSYIYHNLTDIPHIRKGTSIRFSKKALIEYIKR